MELIAKWGTQGRANTYRGLVKEVGSEGISKTS